jgi:hypothetical protein
MRGGILNYLYYPLDFQLLGKTVEVTIPNNSCKVMLLDDLNLARYKSGNQYEYIGGQTIQSTILVTIPDNRRWHAVVDFGDAACTSSVSVRVI